MTNLERRNAFIYGILNNVWLSLEHATRLVGSEYSKLINFNDEEGRKLVINAYEEVEEAKRYFERKVDEQTAWEKDNEI